MYKLKITSFIGILLLLITMACKGPHDKNEARSVAADSSQSITPQFPNKEKTGVGPITEEIVLGTEIDTQMVAAGKKIFQNRCSGCHRIHEDVAAPALGGVLQERSAQFVMNMILNPQGMIENNPEVMAMRGQYATDMVDVGLSKEEARQVVEYLRTY